MTTATNGGRIPARILIPLAGLLVCMMAATPVGNFAKPGSVFFFVPLMLAASGFYLAAVSSYQQLAPSLRIQIFWGVAIVLRLSVLGMPAGDDMHRYLWEGSIQWHGYNPYLLNPNSPIFAPFQDASWSQINHRDWAAIYPPGAELFLKMATAFGPSVILIKVACLLADLIVIQLLLRLNTGQARHRETAWYAWNPLVVYCFAGAGHFDSLMLAPLMLAVYALFRSNPLGKKPSHWGWASFAAFALGISISIKLVPLVLIPVFALALRSRMIVLLLAGIVPWLTATYYGFPQTAIFDALREFSYVTRFNDFVWWISEKFIWANPAQKNGVYNFIAMGVACVLSLIALRNWRRALLWVLGSVLIFSTVIHPWYLTWILPFAAMQKARSWFVLSSTIFLAFLWWETTPLWTAWQKSTLLSLSISLPPLLFCIYEFLQTRAHHFNGKRRPKPELQSQDTLMQ